ncbi:MAG: AI-2E family transporter, partial [Chloroflexota bacterium]
MGKINTWSKESRIIATLAVFAIAIGTVWFLRGVLGPLVMAALFAFVLNPAVEFLERKTKLKHGGAVAVIYFAALLLVSAVPAILTPVMINQIQDLELDLAGLVELYETNLDAPYVIGNWIFTPGQFLPDLPAVSTDLFTPLAEATLKAVEIV